MAVPVVNATIVYLPTQVGASHETKIPDWSHNFTGKFIVNCQKTAEAAPNDGIRALISKIFGSHVRAKTFCIKKNMWFKTRSERNDVNKSTLMKAYRFAVNNPAANPSDNELWSFLLSNTADKVSHPVLKEPQDQISSPFMTDRHPDARAASVSSECPQEEVMADHSNVKGSVERIQAPPSGDIPEIPDGQSTGDACSNFLTYLSESQLTGGSPEAVVTRVEVLLENLKTAYPDGVPIKLKVRDDIAPKDNFDLADADFIAGQKALKLLSKALQENIIHTDLDGNTVSLMNKDAVKSLKVNYTEKIAELKVKIDSGSNRDEILSEIEYIGRCIEDLNEQQGQLSNIESLMNDLYFTPFCKAVTQATGRRKYTPPISAMKLKSELDPSRLKDLLVDLHAEIKDLKEAVQEKELGSAQEYMAGLCTVKGYNYDSRQALVHLGARLTTELQVGTLSQKGINKTLQDEISELKSAITNLRDLRDTQVPGSIDLHESHSRIDAAISNMERAIKKLEAANRTFLDDINMSHPDSVGKYIETYSGSRDHAELSKKIARLEVYIASFPEGMSEYSEEGVSRNNAILALNSLSSEFLEKSSRVNRTEIESLKRKIQEYETVFTHDVTVLFMGISEADSPVLSSLLLISESQIREKMQALAGEYTALKNRIVEASPDDAKLIEMKTKLKTMGRELVKLKNMDIAKDIDKKIKVLDAGLASAEAGSYQAKTIKKARDLLISYQTDYIAHTEDRSRLSKLSMERRSLRAAAREIQSITRRIQ